jgi:hypothetical protein
MITANEIMQSMNKKLQGYKIMTYLDKDKKLHSMADARLTLPLKKNSSVNVRAGFWLGTTKEYVSTYYGSDIDDPNEMDLGEYEMLLTFEYSLRDVTDGDPNSTPAIADHGGVEFAVSKAKLISAYNVTTTKKTF